MQPLSVPHLSQSRNAYPVILAPIKVKIAFDFYIARFASIGLVVSIVCILLPSRGTRNISATTPRYQRNIKQRFRIRSDEHRLLDRLPVREQWVSWFDQTSLSRRG